jgi:hypothetical protein
MRDGQFERDTSEYLMDQYLLNNNANMYSNGRVGMI